MNILQSSTGKQIAGGLGGMAIAGLLYIAVDQASYLNIKGLLVSTNTVSENAGQVSTNTTNIDEEAQRRLESRAAGVAAQLSSSAAAEGTVQIAETPLSNNVAERRAARVFANQLATDSSNAKTYANDPNAVISVEERVAMRAQAGLRAAAQASSASTAEVAGIQNGYPVYVPQQVIQRVEVPVEKEVIKEVVKEVPVVKEVIKQVPVEKEVIREVVKEVPVVKEVIKEVPVVKQVVKEVPVYVSTPIPTRKHLPDSGPGLFLIGGAAAGITAMKRRMRSRSV